MSNGAIAFELGISENTLEAHMARLFQILEVNKRAEAVVRAYELGILKSEDSKDPKDTRFNSA